MENISYPTTPETFLVVVDLMIQRKDFLALEPFYRNLEFVRLFVDKTEKLDVLGVDDFMLGYVEYIRNTVLRTSLRHLVPLVKIISNAEGIVTIINQIIVTILEDRNARNESYFYTEYYEAIDLFRELGKYLADRYVKSSFSALGYVITSILLSSSSQAEQYGNLVHLHLSRMDFLDELSKMYISEGNYIAHSVFFGISQSIFYTLKYLRKNSDHALARHLAEIIYYESWILENLRPVEAHYLSKLRTKDNIDKDIIQEALDKVQEALDKVAAK